MIEQQYFLYILYDPTFISQTFYVGYSNNPDRRLIEHIRIKEENIHKDNWIDKLSKRSIEPTYYLICSFDTKKKAKLAEIDMIALCKYIDLKIVNKTNGGDEPPHKYGEQHNSAKLKYEEVKEIRRLFFDGKITRKELSKRFNVSSTNIGDIIKYKIWKNDIDIPDNLQELIQQRTKEDREKLEESRSGNKHPLFGIKASDEKRKKLSESHKGQKSWNKGKKMPEEICIKNSISHLGIPAWNNGKKMSEEYSEKCRQRQLGKKYSQETKNKHSILSSGENNASAKLNIEKVLSIRTSYATEDISYSKLAKQFGVDKTTIAQIIKRKTWTHI